MKSIFIKKIRFGSHCKLVTSTSVTIGLIFGLFMLIIGILGGPVTATFGNTEVTGLLAGIVGLFMAPIIFYFFGLIIALISFFPSKFSMLILKKIKINGDFETDEEISAENKAALKSEKLGVESDSKEE